MFQNAFQKVSHASGETSEVLWQEATRRVGNQIQLGLCEMGPAFSTNLNCCSTLVVTLQQIAPRVR